MIVEKYRARCGVDQAGDNLQERGFATSGRTDNGHEAALRDRQVNAIERNGGLSRCTKYLAYATDAQKRRRGVGHRPLKAALGPGW